MSADEQSEATSVYETVLRRITRHERDSPHLKTFLCDKFNIVENDIIMFVNCLKSDAPYRIENVWNSTKFTIAFSRDVMHKRNIKSLCPCADAYARGEPVQHTYVVEHGFQCERYDVPFYSLYVFSTASIALALLVSCLHCLAKKFVFRYGREHHMGPRDHKYELFLLRMIQDELGHALVSVNDDAWPNGEVVYTRYAEALRSEFLDPALVTQRTDARYVSDVCMPKLQCADSPNVLFVQSPCGSGKSQFSVAAICYWFDQNVLPNGVFLPVATKAQAAAHTAAFQTAFPGFVFGQGTHPRDLKILHYRKDDITVGQTCAARVKNPASDVITFGNLSSICTINSMVKHFQYYDASLGQFRIHIPSLVWMDEIVSLLDALSLSEHMKGTEGGRSKAIKFFEEIVAHCDYIIATDAYLNTASVEYVMTLRRRANRNDKVEVVQFDSRFRINRCYIHHNKEDEFMHHVAENIKAGNRCLVLSDSKATCLKVFNGVAEVCPDKQLKLYSADTADDVKDHDFEHCEEVWVSADALFSTPALTTGVNFTKQHFHNCFFFATGMSVSARTTLQMMNRVRSYIDSEIFVYTPVRYAVDLMPTAEEDARACQAVLSNERFEQELAPDLRGQFDLDENHALVYAPVAQMAISFLREHTESRRDYTYEFVRYAAFSGYDILLGIPLARNSPVVTGEVSPATEPQEAEIAELECPVVHQAATMLTAHEHKQVEKFARLAQLELAPEYIKSTRHMSEFDRERNKMLALKLGTGLRFDEPVTPEFVERFYDKTHFFQRLKFLDHVCRFSEEHPMVAFENCEADFFKRLKPDPTYFVWGLQKVTSLLNTLGVLAYDPFTPAEDVLGSQSDLFPLGATIPKPKHREPLPADIAEHLKQSYVAYCKQFGRDINRKEFEREPTVYTLFSLFTAAVSRLGIAVKQSKRGRDHTVYILKAKDECELYLVKMLRPIQADQLQLYNRSTLKQLCRFLFLTRETPAWEAVHGMSFDALLRAVSQ